MPRQWTSYEHCSLAPVQGIDNSLTQDGGLHAYLHMAANLGVAVSRLIASAAQGHMLHDGHMVAHSGSLTHHNACSRMLLSYPWDHDLQLSVTKPAYANRLHSHAEHTHDRYQNHQ